MEIIKKTVLQALTTGTTTGCTGSCYVIIPDTGATYYFKIGLVQEAIDFGFFDIYETGITQTTGNKTWYPTVTTGVLSGLHQIFITDSIIKTSGEELITEYGVLYTSNEDYKTSDMLVYANSPTFVDIQKIIVSTVLTLPFNFSKRIFPSSLVLPIYYRAYAKNSNGIGYGEIKMGYVNFDPNT